jgi:hypothetical protein
METVETNGNAKLCFKFICENCAYKTNKRSCYDSHTKSLRHVKKAQLETELCPNYACLNCNKLFANRSGLWKHNKKCGSNKYLSNSLTTETTNAFIIQNNDTKQLTELVMKVVEQNQELTKQIVELSKSANKITHNSINNSTINSHNKFNLNVFLNEQCKDALNISDFVSSLVLSINDLEETTRLGYSEGISKIFINGLKQLDFHNRPVHCSDLKREILYIKDNDEWTKDTEEKNALTKAIKIVANKNIKQITVWQKENPEYLDPESRQNDKYMKIICGAMSGSSKEESETNYEKIIKKIARETVIEKE